MELSRETDKLAFDIPRMFALIRQAIKPYPKAMLFELKDKGYTSLFEQLVACILSIRTLDEVSGPAAEKLLKKAPTPKKILNMPIEELSALVQKCTFPSQKVNTLRKVSEYILEEHQGHLPEQFDEVVALPGVGPKCAGLALGIACGQERIGVDVHVHRVTNRWGYVHTNTPEKTMGALEKVLPRAKWVEINELLVPFGKHICLRVRPKCSSCPVLKYCRQVGVTSFQ